MGSCCMVWLSTENPTPAPHIERYITSAKSSNFDGAIYEQLSPATFVFLAAGPAAHISRMDGITLCSNMASLTSLYSQSLNFLPRFSFIKSIYLSTVSIHVSQIGR